MSLGESFLGDKLLISKERERKGSGEGEGCQAGEDKKAIPFKWYI